MQAQNWINSAKYNDLIATAVANKNIDLYTQPFLYLWQQRFNGTLPDYWTLSSIAASDVVILLVILAMTLLAFVLGHRTSLRQDEDARLLRAHLNRII